MEYKVHNDQYTTTTQDVVYKNDWNINDLYNSEFTMNELMNTLETVAAFRRKYPNDDTVQAFEEIVRNEICKLVGGSLYGNI